MTDIGEIEIDITSCRDHGDILTAPADQIFAIKFSGVDAGQTNCALQMTEGETEFMTLNKKGSGYSGNVSGSYIGTAGQTGAEVTRNIPLFINETVGFRLSGTAGSGNMVCIVYMRIQ
jgi:hypothetical protein